MNNQRRRSLLKSIGIGSVWSTPVVASVMLPAHATTSNIVVNKEYASAGTDQFKVPEGVTQLKITVNGAGGGTANSKGSKKGHANGGNGGQHIKTVTTVPGEMLSITVGGGGQDGSYNNKKKLIPGSGGTPGGGNDATGWGGGGGGLSQVTGINFTVRAPGGGGSGVSDIKISKGSRGGKGGGINGGSGGKNISDGGNGGNGLGGLGSTNSDTVNNPLQGEDGNVKIAS